MKLTGNYPKVLYFTADMVPTPDEATDALSYGHNTAMRNASVMHEIMTEGSIEKADYYAGKIPAVYIKYRPKQCIKSPVKLPKVTGNMVTTDDTAIGGDGTGLPPPDAGLAGHEIEDNVKGKAAEATRQMRAAGWHKNA